MNKKTLEMFSTMPPLEAVVKNAIPAMLAMLMVLIYNLADTFFVSQTNDAFQVAAVSLATPVFLIFTAVGTVFGIGGTSVISRAVGEGRLDYAKKVSAFCMWASVIVGILMSLSLWLFMDPLLTMIGASSETWDFTKSYLSIVAICGPFVLIGTSFSNILRTEGQVNKAMLGMLIGNLLNIILDPIMILGFGWDITGAAIASVIGNIVGASYYILYFLRGQSMLSVHIKNFSLRDHIPKAVLSIGIPASLGAVLMSVSQIVVLSQMAGYGDMAVAGIGVSMKIVMITGMLCIGLGQGVQPLLGFSIGAKDWTRYKKIMHVSLLFALGVGGSLTLLCYLFIGPIVGVFLNDPNAYDYGISFTRILLSTSFLFGVFYVVLNALQAMGAAVSSLIINLSRQGLIYIPAIFILNAMLQANGLAFAQPVADVLSLILASGLYLYVTKKVMHTEANVAVDNSIS